VSGQLLLRPAVRDRLCDELSEVGEPPLRMRREELGTGPCRCHRTPNVATDLDRRGKGGSDSEVADDLRRCVGIRDEVVNPSRHAGQQGVLGHGRLLDVDDHPDRNA
jgi:hypothetical protein